MGGLTTVHEDASSRAGDEPASSKFAPPRGRGGGVSRRRLIDRARASRASLVSLAAPAGYGKSTLLREWAELDDRVIVWVSLDRFDNDPSALINLLARAFDRAVPGDERLAAVAALPMTGPAVLGRAAPMLAAAIELVDSPFVLVLDDVHEAATPACQDALEVALARIPTGSQVVMASRRVPEFLSRLRLGGEVVEIGADQLRLDAGDARRVFDTLEAAADDEDLARLVAHTEGWPTGIALAALAARDGGHPVDIDGDDRFVADYLYRACFRALDADDQSFLRRTALLEHLSAGCCDAVLARDDSRARLSELEHRGLFLVPIDRRRGDYRYHQLFREFLLAEFDRVEPGEGPELHRRAAAWCEQHGEVAFAIEHLLAAGDRRRSVRLVAERALGAYQAGELAAVARWMHELGQEAIAGYPPLVVLAGLRAILDGHAAEADGWARLFDRIEYDGPAEFGLPNYDSARAMVRAIMWRDGLAAATADAAFALASESPSSLWYDQALHLIGWTRLLAGETEGAIEAFERASGQAELFGNADSLALSEGELAIIALDRGDVAKADRHVDRGLTAIAEHGMDGYATTTLVLAVGARVAIRRHDAAAAKRLLARAMRDRGLCTHVIPVLAVKVRLELARAFVALGDGSTAAHLLEEVDDLLRVRSGLGTLLDDVAELRSSMEQSRDALGASPLTPAELRLLPYLQTHLTIGEIGDRLFVSRNTVSSQLGSIYRKLRVTTRGAAVERAQELRLLG
ncbi:AAA family ATPase [Agromyces lapidis]|uniref:AAA family ATPase n=1 Tax=Agromyces lapidis TaxID=279574 RepID=A0ABV5SSS2_9MICO|nr:AAA family ATPase [Agromyces lapidis]